MFNKTSDFDKFRNYGGKDSFAFGTHDKRFQNYNVSPRATNLPSPNSYSTQPRTFSPEVAKSKGWSVGVGRDNMLKLHIDRLNDEATKKIASPSPGAYEKDPTFGKKGPHYSMRKRMNRYGSRVDKFDNYNFDQEKKLPGPGYYMHPETVGTQMMSSTFKTSQQSSIPKAKDRFMAPTIHKQHPSPNQYQPKADIVQHVASNHPKVPMTRFGMDKSHILDNQWGKKAAETTPGPGQYGRWSDFTKDIK